MSLCNILVSLHDIYCHIWLSLRHFRCLLCILVKMEIFIRGGGPELFVLIFHLEVRYECKSLVLFTSKVIIVAAKELIKMR